jgi:hypothetical protein
MLQTEASFERQGENQIVMNRPVEPGNEKWSSASLRIAGDGGSLGGSDQRPGCAPRVAVQRASHRTLEGDHRRDRGGGIKIKDRPFKFGTACDLYAFLVTVQ